MLPSRLPREVYPVSRVRRQPIGVRRDAWTHIKGTVMKVPDDRWDLRHLHRHFQAAVDLEIWTIPYYMAAMFSIVDRSSEAYQLIQSVVHQEMLHLQLACNVSNAYGYTPVFHSNPFPYKGSTIPHLNFTLDLHNPAELFTPYSAEIGPLDEFRINGMCLLEYPEWETGCELDYRDTVDDYPHIGTFYDAVEYGARQLASHIVGGVNQVDLFSAYYRNLPKMTVEMSGKAGLPQVELLLEIIRDQGEAAKAVNNVAVPFRNTADDPAPNSSHYEKLCQIRAGTLPDTYPVKDPSAYTADDHKRRAILIENFARFMHVLDDLFAGRNPDKFSPLMMTLGGNILACWKSGVTPKFTSKESDSWAHHHREGIGHGF